MQYSLKSLLALAIPVIGMAGSPFAHGLDTLDKVEQTGKLVAGVKVDYRPFGFRSETGAMQGLEHDLVADIAAKLSERFGKQIEVEKVVVTAQNRMQFLEQGRIDFMIATMNDTPERRKIIDIIQPNYYASGVNLLTRKSNNLSAWEELEGKTVCALQGAWYNKSLSQEYKFEAQPYAGVMEAAQAALDDRCIGFLDDDSHGTSLLLSGGEWSDFEMPLKTLSEAPWGMAIAHGNPKMRAFLDEVAEQWHRSGLIVELEKKWGIKPTAWVQTMHDKYKAN